MGDFLYHEACPCGRSSDGLAVYQEEDGSLNKYCFVYGCNRYFSEDVNNNTEPENMDDKMRQVQSLPFSRIPDRKIRRSVAEKYGVRVSFDEVSGQIDRHYYPMFKNGEITGYQVRVLPKDFRSVGDCKGRVDLFGKNVVGEKGRLLIITEGHLDCLAAYQMILEYKKTYRVVSLPRGCQLSDIKNNLEWIEGFETVVFCFDQDEVGKKFANDASELLTPGRVKIMSFSEKDASDMLMKGKIKEFWNALWNARSKTPEGIVSIEDTWERLVDRPVIESIPYPKGWNLINDKVIGLRLSEVDTWTGGTSIGKSLFLKIIMNHLHQTTNDPIGAIYLEEPVEDTIEDMMSIRAGTRLRLPNGRQEYPVGSDQYRSLWESVAYDNRLHFFDHWGSVEEDAKLLSKIRYMAKGLGCKWICLDHLSIVVSEFAEEGQERARIDSLMSKLKRLTQELNIWIGLIVHLRKHTEKGKDFENGAVPTLDDLRGSAAIKQLSNNVFGIARNLYHESDLVRNQSDVHVLKCRFTGKTGPADSFRFNERTGLVEPVSEGIVT